MMKLAVVASAIGCRNVVDQSMDRVGRWVLKITVSCTLPQTCEYSVCVQSRGEFFILTRLGNPGTKQRLIFEATKVQTNLDAEMDLYQTYVVRRLNHPQDWTNHRYQGETSSMPTSLFSTPVKEMTDRCWVLASCSTSSTSTFGGYFSADTTTVEGDWCPLFNVLRRLNATHQRCQHGRQQCHDGRLSVYLCSWLLGIRTIKQKEVHPHRREWI